MATSDYIQPEELKASLELTGTAFAEADISRAITAASRGIDKMCNRRFYADTNDATRYYTMRESLVQIDDLSAAPTSVSVATSLSSFTAGTLNSDYDLEPLNALADNAPYTVVRAVNWWPNYRYWPGSVPRGNLKVVGKFGWPSVPDQVPQACSILAAKLLVRTRQAPFGIVTAGADVGVAMRIARTDPDVASLLDGLIRTDLF